MANFFENTDWQTVRRVEIGEPVTGGAAGTINVPLAALSGRDEWLKIQLEKLAQSIKDEMTARIAAEQKMESSIGSITLVPTGTMIDFAGASPPNGYLLCDGRAVSRTLYANLYSVLGTSWGQGDGSTTFNIPNAIDKFSEGSLASGKYKEAGLPNITGYYADNGFDTTGSAAGAFYVGGGNVWRTGHGDACWNYIHSACFDASRASAVYGKSQTVQPASYTVLKCIKY